MRASLQRFDPQTILDVGCGSADIPRTLLREARACAERLTITAVDASAQVLEIARRRNSEPSLVLVQADGARLPFDDSSFDVAMCNLTLHHCDPQSAVALLRELRRVARLTPLVTDLRRSWLAWLGAKALTAISTRNRLTRHDAPLSVLRAYTPREAIELARAAGWRNPRVTRAPFYRMALTDA